MNFLENLFGGKLFKKSKNKPKDIMIIIKDYLGNYLLPLNYKKVEEVGSVQELVYKSVYDSLSESINQKINPLNIDVNAVYFNPEKGERPGPTPYHKKIYLQPLKLTK